MTIPSAAVSGGAPGPNERGPDAAPPALHGTFALVVDVQAAPADLYAAFTQGETRRRWLRLPGTTQPQSPLDYRVGVSETLRSTLSIDDAIQSVERRTHILDLAPARRLVFSYQATVDAVRRWISLVTVEIDAAHEPAARLTWTEQYAFLVLTGDGADDVAHLRGGTRLQLNGLAVALGAVPRPAVERCPDRSG